MVYALSSQAAFFGRRQPAWPTDQPRFCSGMEERILIIIPNFTQTGIHLGAVYQRSIE